jgi:hypothetical protein
MWLFPEKPTGLRRNKIIVRKNLILCEKCECVLSTNALTLNRSNEVAMWQKVVSPEVFFRRWRKKKFLKPSLRKNEEKESFRHWPRQVHTDLAVKGLQMPQVWVQSNQKRYIFDRGMFLKDWLKWKKTPKQINVLTYQKPKHTIFLLNSTFSASWSTVDFIREFYCIRMYVHTHI